jgi:hypothetical protein
MKLLAGQCMYPRPCPAKRIPAAQTMRPTSNSGVFILLPFDPQFSLASTNCFEQTDDTRAFALCPLLAQSGHP